VNIAVAELFDGVDDLIRRVAHTENPEIRRIRARVHAALVAAKNECGHTAKATRHSAAPPPYLVELPAPTLGVAFLLGLGVCLMVSAQS
jgi:ElaB/YqjD/DUF883 family membrane-anchored ribosome-binding protein